LQGLAYFRGGNIKDGGISLEQAEFRLGMIDQFNEQKVEDKCLSQTNIKT